MPASLAIELEQLETRITGAEAALEELDRDEQDLSQSLASLEALLRPHADAAPLPLGPMLWGLFATIAALGAAFCTYLLFVIGHGDSDIGVALFFDIALIVGASLAVAKSSRPGAGGRARQMLQAASFLLIVMSFLGALSFFLGAFLGFP